MVSGTLALLYTVIQLPLGSSGAVAPTGDEVVLNEDFLSIHLLPGWQALRLGPVGGLAGLEAWLAGRPWLDGSHGWQAGKPDWEVRLAGWLRELAG